MFYMCSNCGMKSIKHRKYIKECNANVFKSNLILLRERKDKNSYRKKTKGFSECQMTREESQGRKIFMLLTGFVDVLSLILEFNLI